MEASFQYNECLMILFSLTIALGVFQALVNDVLRDTLNNFKMKFKISVAGLAAPAPFFVKADECDLKCLSQR